MFQSIRFRRRKKNFFLNQKPKTLDFYWQSKNERPFRQATKFFMIHPAIKMFKKSKKRDTLKGTRCHTAVPGILLLWRVACHSCPQAWPEPLPLVNLLCCCLKKAKDTWCKICIIDSTHLSAAACRKHVPVTYKIFCAAVCKSNIVMQLETQIFYVAHVCSAKGKAHQLLIKTAFSATHHHLSLNREGRWGATDDFTTSFLHFSLFFTAL